MRVAEYEGKRIAVWGLGREGRAAIHFIRQRLPKQSITVLDDNLNAEGAGIPNVDFVLGKESVRAAIPSFDVIVKSPGISPYDPPTKALLRDKVVTSLMNLWFAEPRTAPAICVTGTKGKSTTSSLIAHVLKSTGRAVDLVGNIGVPISDANAITSDFVVVEVSSYQAADFSETCEFGVLTSLFPEHLDWHLSVEQYYHDKLNLIRRSGVAVVNFDFVDLVSKNIGDGGAGDVRYFNDPKHIHSLGADIYDGKSRVGTIDSSYLNRSHNRSNLCAVLTLCQELGIDLSSALDAAKSFKALPHRQQELGTLDGVLYVDDSISTTPESTIAALTAYSGRSVTVILGGFDRGIEYKKLVDHLSISDVAFIILVGPSGDRIFQLLRACDRYRTEGLYLAGSMQAAVEHAKLATPDGGVILLSPAAPSYGSYVNFEERGRHFASVAGLTNPFYADNTHVE